MSDSEPIISIVVPIYNESEILPELWHRLSQVLTRIPYSCEVIFIDDGSTDNSLSIIEELSSKNSEVRVLALSRNFGHQSALTAGLDHTQGHAVILMDADLQDKPEAIIEFIREWEAGHEVVYATRVRRKENLSAMFACKLFYRLLSYLSGIRIPIDAGIFCLLDRKAVAVFKSLPEHHRYFPGLRAFLGFSQKGITVERNARFSGRSRVGLMGKIRLALDGIFSFSYLPLRIATWLGLIVALASFVVMINVLYKKIVSGEAIQGWASIMTSILFIGACQLLTLGILGEYIGRIYEEAKKRPYYIVARKIGFPDT